MSTISGISGSTSATIQVATHRAPTVSSIADIAKLYELTHKYEQKVVAITETTDMFVQYNLYQELSSLENQITQIGLSASGKAHLDKIIAAKTGVVNTIMPAYPISAEDYHSLSSYVPPMGTLPENIPDYENLIVRDNNGQPVTVDIPGKPGKYYLLNYFARPSQSLWGFRPTLADFFQNWDNNYLNFSTCFEGTHSHTSNYTSANALGTIINPDPSGTVAPSLQFSEAYINASLTRVYLGFQGQTSAKYVAQYSYQHTTSSSAQQTALRNLNNSIHNITVQTFSITSGGNEISPPDTTTPDPIDTNPSVPEDPITNPTLPEDPITNPVIPVIIETIPSTDPVPPNEDSTPLLSDPIDTEEISLNNLQNLGDLSLEFSSLPEGILRG